jgi:predicted DNA binding CopG/RHH family protein
MFDKDGYTSAPKSIADAIAASEKVVDLLPSPEHFIKKQAVKKITINLNANSLDFFKSYAKKHNVKYQTMINNALTLYAQKCQR